ncbi:TonB-dependent receptor [Asticcacaulis sp.]|uniref:TonB-dependent receptor n=1 Tax=Asticcacaulis sp. TaxID=1872648 RepID=UPI002CA4A8D6|nr:TonB-dependent receptor [Asticcacaulis sp.]HTM82048.1 TonB-dependent receptor [Asticcacaulis sp.]
MKKLSLRSGLMATTTICGAVLSTLAGGALVATVATMLPTVAQAQDYTSGALVGTVTGTGGTPVSGATVTLTSVGQGQARTLTTNANGQFTAAGLQPGEYTVNVSASGYTDYVGTAQIVISQETRFSYEMSAVGAQPQTVVVKGKRVRQDFTKTTTGLTVDLDTLTSQQPIARSLTAVTMLAPTVTKGNPGFGDVASFGGGSVAENAYYINGLNVTNPDTYVGGADVPFDFYKTIEVKTGGYAAEYGRATGGVVNATTKSGTNDFMFGVHANYQPSDLRADQASAYNRDGHFATAQDNSLSVEAGGALWKDHLFAYGLYQTNDTYSTLADTRNNVYQKIKNGDPFYGVKLDAYITPTQHFEYTYWNTERTNVTDKWDFDPTTGVIGDRAAHSTNDLGGDNWVAKYTGNVTDWFTVSAAVGQMKTRDDIVPTDTTSYAVYDQRDGTAELISDQKNTAVQIDDVERKFWRADGDIRFELAGRHHVRFGVDHEENSMTKLNYLTGNQPVQYSFRHSAAQGDYLRVVYERLGGGVSAENQSYYLQDSWDVTSNLNLQIGLRNDDFSQNNLSGEQYLDLTGNVAPRLGFSWDPTGEGVWKVYGSYGANFIPPAMNLGYRGKDLYYIENFHAPTGGFVLDPTTGLPAAVGDPFALTAAYAYPCPVSDLASAPGFNAVNAAPGAIACHVYGNGTQEAANAKTAEGLQATQEDEVILGATYRVDDLWTVGLSYTYRNLKRISEDSDFQDAIINYLDANGLDSSQYTDGTISSSYYVWNVGDHGATFTLKSPLPGETEQRTLTLSADDLGHYHDPKREYQALVFDFKRAFDGKWGLQGSYTWSKSYGNYEGTVKSDVGNDQQTDAGATIAFDSPGFEDYGTGLLPNDRTHTLKLWGSYSFNPNFLIGANVLVQSPAKFGCLGVHPTDPYAESYGAYSHYCGGEPAPQGKGPKGDWTKTLDLSLRYTVPEKYAIGGNLVLRADIFNVFDNHSVTARYVEYEYSSDYTDPANRDPDYGSVLSYNTPRYVRLGFDLTY